MLQPTTILIGEADRCRSISLHWTNRAAYRLATLPDLPSIDEVRTGGMRSYAYLVAHLWAMLADERDRRRFPTPEDLAACLSEDPVKIDAYWRTMWKHAFDFDVDNPPPPPPEPAAGSAAEPEGSEQKSTSAKLSPLPS